MLSMTIGGTTEKALAMSLRINDNINARSTASFSIDTDETYETGQEVLIYDDTELIYGGQIDSYRLTYLRGGTDGKRRRYAVSCIDFNQVLDRRRVAYVYEGETLGYIVNHIVDNFLTDEDITVGTIAKSTTIVTKAVFNRVTVSDAFTFLRDAVGGDLNYNIDYNKELTFFQRADNSDTGFTDETCLSMSLAETRQEYRNSQIVRAGDGTTEVKVKLQPTPKPDGVSRVFSNRFPLAKKPTIYVDDVEVDGDDVGINGLDIEKKWYWNKGLKEIVQDETETVISDTSKIEVSYQGLVKIVVSSNDSAAQNTRSSIEGGSGIYEAVLNKSDLDDRDAAIDLCNGLLVRYGEIPRSIEISSETIRSSGKLIRVSSDNLVLNEDFLITSVDISDLDGCGTLRYIIRAASGEDLGSWVEFFRSLSENENISISENEVLVILQTISEATGWCGELQITVFQPSVCSETSICSDTKICGNAAIIEETIYD